MRTARPAIGLLLSAATLAFGCSDGPLEPADYLGAWDVVEWRTLSGRFAVPGTVTLTYGGEATIVHYVYTFSTPDICRIDVLTTESEGSYTNCTYVVDPDRRTLHVEIEDLFAQRGTVSGTEMTLVRDLFPVGADTLLLRKR